MHSSLKRSLIFLTVSLILIFAFGILYGFSYEGMLSTFGSALVLFVTFSLFFLGFFGLLHLLSSNSLQSNPWVVDVNEMDRWFNPMYPTWLFYHDHKKWAKENTLLSSVLTVIFGTSFWLVFIILSVPRTILGNSVTNSLIGWAITMALMVPFAASWYLYYTSVDRTPSPFPKARLSDLPRRL